MVGAKNLGRAVMRLGTSCCSRLPFPLIEGVAPSLIAPFYHLVTDDHVPHVAHLYSYRTPTLFTRDLDFFVSRYKFIGLPELLDALNGRTQLMHRSVLLTFDDGLRECHDVIAPILIKMGIPATFFVCTAFLDNKEMFYRHKASLLIEAVQKREPPHAVRPKIVQCFDRRGLPFHDFRSAILAVDHHHRAILDEVAELLELSFTEYLQDHRPYLDEMQVRSLLNSGFSVGSHSIDHPLFSSLTLKDQIDQVVISLQGLKSRFGISEDSFSFPYHDWGVTNEFFREMYRRFPAMISFGGSRLRTDVYPRHVQRFSMEGDSHPSRRILSRQYGERAIRLLLRRDRINRP